MVFLKESLIKFSDRTHPNRILHVQIVFGHIHISMADQALDRCKIHTKCLHLRDISHAAESIVITSGFTLFAHARPYAQNAQSSRNPYPLDHAENKNTPPSSLAHPVNDGGIFYVQPRNSKSLLSSPSIDHCFHVESSGISAAAPISLMIASRSNSTASRSGLHDN